VADAVEDCAEGRRLVSAWSQGTFHLRKDSIRYHHDTHGRGAGLWMYLASASAFKMDGARARVRADGTAIYLRRDGEFLIRSAEGIISYGRNG
jgi:hypothetical protein